MAHIRTRANLSTRAFGGLALAVAALLLGILVARFAPMTPFVGGDSQPPDVIALPPDVVALGTEVAPLPPQGMIPRDQALDVARREYSDVFQQGHIDAYLVELTDPYQLGGLQDRPIWIIKATGLSLDVFSGPMLPDGTAADVPRATLAFIYVDGVTGEWLSAWFRE